MSHQLQFIKLHHFKLETLKLIVVSRELVKQVAIWAKLFSNPETDIDIA